MNENPPSPALLGWRAALAAEAWGEVANLAPGLLGALDGAGARREVLEVALGWRKAARLLGEPRQEAVAGMALGDVFTRLGQPRRGAEAFDEARDAAEKGGARGVMGAAWLASARARLSAGDAAGARDRFAAARAFFEGEGDAAQAAQAAAGEGLARAASGDPQGAIDCHRAHRVWAEAAGDRAGVAADARFVGLALVRLGRVEEGLGALGEARALASEVGDVRAEGICLRAMAYVHRQRGELAAAEAHLRALLPLADALGDQAGATLFRQELGDLARDQGRPDEARTWWTAALERAEGSHHDHAREALQARLAPVEGEPPSEGA